MNWYLQVRFFITNLIELLRKRNEAATEFLAHLFGVNIEERLVVGKSAAGTASIAKCTFLIFVFFLNLGLLFFLHHLD